MTSKNKGLQIFRRLSIVVHRELGFFFAGIVCIYGISGIYMNHRHQINPNYSVDITEFSLSDPIAPDARKLSDKTLAGALTAAGVDPATVTKHYRVKDNFKILIKGGSSITIDPASRRAVYEKVEPRPLVGQMVRLHYNPGRWWTWFSDIFATSLILLAVTGCVITGGRRGLIGRGGLLLLLGISVPIIFLMAL